MPSLVKTREKMVFNCTAQFSVNFSKFWFDVAFLNSLLKVGLRLLRINLYRFACVERDAQIVIAVFLRNLQKRKCCKFQALGSSHTHVGMIL